MAMAWRLFEHEVGRADNVAFAVEANAYSDDGVFSARRIPGGSLKGLGDRIARHGQQDDNP